MTPTITVMKRELRSYFLSPIAYVIGAVFLSFVGYLFFQMLFIEFGRAAQARMDLYFYLLPIAFLFLAPALTMRLWAEERKLGTLELLLTFPVKTTPLIFGKFFAGVVFIAILLLLTLPYPITLASLGNLAWGPVIGGYLGALLLASSFLALGLFTSSITRDQIISLILSIVALAVFYLMGSGLLQYLFSARVVAVLTELSPFTHFNSIARGVIDIGDLIYYVVFCGFFLFANSVMIEIKKWQG